MNFLLNNRLAAVFCLSAALSIPAANAGIYVFTDHQVVAMVQHGVNKYDDVRFPTGDIPYVGRLGLEYERKNWSYQLGYIHRSNVDISGEDEYNYNGVSLGIKYRHCLYRCD